MLYEFILYFLIALAMIPIIGLVFCLVFDALDLFLPESYRIHATKEYLSLYRKNTK